MRNLTVPEVLLHDVQQLSELTEDQDLVTCLYQLGKHSVKELEFARNLEDMIAVQLANWSMALEKVRVIADFSQLHDGVLQGGGSLVDFVWVHHELVAILDTLVNELLLG